MQAFRWVYQLLYADFVAAWSSNKPYDKAYNREDDDAKHPKDFGESRGTWCENLINRIYVCDEDDET